MSNGGRREARRYPFWSRAPAEGISVMYGVVALAACVLLLPQSAAYTLPPTGIRSVSDVCESLTTFFYLIHLPSRVLSC